MPLHLLEKIPAREFFPGFRGRILHTPDLTLAFWEIDADCELPLHRHPERQLVQVLEGRFALNVAGEEVLLTPGTVYEIPGDVPHSGRSLSPCRILDIFSPARKDLQSG